MTQIFNRFPQRITRNKLRKGPVEAEAILWSKLNRRQRLGKKFRRQYSVGRYIVDFYCPAMQLVIEIDGDSHKGNEAKQYDQVREKFLKALGLRVIRFSNADIRENLSDVLETIDDQVR